MVGTGGRVHQGVGLLEFPPRPPCRAGGRELICSGTGNHPGALQVTWFPEHFSAGSGDGHQRRLGGPGGRHEDHSLAVAASDPIEVADAL
ncbi:MAG: hypothetical protein Ct9H300mP12_10970 [Acidimicrobiales bacterium]|nr:MAG: hypothetical protein Ct9H300mP12_10970 [Acidimicrobiales bacterium]